jgi:hypothetical protein
MKKLGCVGLMVAILVACAAPGADAGGRHGVSFRGGVFIGGPFWGGPFWGPRFGWGPGWGGWYGYPYYAYPPPVYAPPVVVEQQPQVFTQQPQESPSSQEPYYWYYCPDSKTYYPYVQQCPGGWLTVVPPAEPRTP